MKDHTPRPAPVYEAFNLDGANRAVVCCATVHIAAKLLGTTYYELSKMGWRKLRDDHPAFEVARSSPGVPLYRPIDARADQEWRATRWKRGV